MATADVHSGLIVEVDCERFPVTIARFRRAGDSMKRCTVVVMDHIIQVYEEDEGSELMSGKLIGEVHHA